MSRAGTMTPQRCQEACAAPRLPGASFVGASVGCALALLGAAHAEQQSRSAQAAPIIDSRITLAQALKGTTAPAGIRESLALVTVRYVSFDRKLHQGQIVVRKDLAREVAAIFSDIEKSGFPIGRAIPVVRYGWSDATSMAANNTSGFDYRNKLGEKRLSQHALGTAIDINPAQNPYVFRGRRLPPSARYDRKARGTIMEGPVVHAFKRRGWRWGGNYRRAKDWQHFSKPTRHRPVSRRAGWFGRLRWAAGTAKFADGRLRIASRFAPDRIILFGSSARGEAGADSDVDLLVIMPVQGSRRDLRVRIRGALHDLPIAKDVLVASPEEYARPRNVTGSVLRPISREGRTLLLTAEMSGRSRRNG